MFIGGFFIALIFSKLQVGRKNKLEFACIILLEYLTFVPVKQLIKHKMEAIIFETEVVETKNNYTVSNTIEKIWSVKKPIMKKILYGVEIKKPTSYRIYQSETCSRRTWVFGDLEINPSRDSINKIAK